MTTCCGAPSSDACGHDDGLGHQIAAVPEALEVPAAPAQSFQDSRSRAEDLRTVREAGRQIVQEEDHHIGRVACRSGPYVRVVQKKVHMAVAHVVRRIRH